MNEGEHEHPVPAPGQPDADSDRDINQLLLAASVVGIMAIDVDGVVRSANPAAAALLGRSADQLVGLALGFPTVVDETRVIDVVQSNGEVRAVEMRVSTATWEGRQLFITALYEPAGEGSERAEVLERQSAALAVTKELDRPLAAIIGILERLRRNEPATWRCGELIDHVNQHAQHLRSLIGRLRSITTADAEHDRMVTQPLRVFEVLLERLHELDERSREVRLRCDAGLVVYVDRAEFSHMLDSYLRNALTHGSPPIDLEAGRRGEWVDVRVCDNGPGVPEQRRPRLFERYPDAGDGDGATEEGPGSSLWVTRSLTLLYGGDAWYEPRLPHGACFYLRLPGTVR